MAIIGMKTRLTIEKRGSHVISPAVRNIVSRTKAIRYRSHRRCVAELPRAMTGTGKISTMRN